MTHYRTLTQEQAISGFVAVHGDKYNYSQVVYVSADSKVKIGCLACKTEGVADYWFYQTPKS